MVRIRGNRLTASLVLRTALVMFFCTLCYAPAVFPDEIEEPVTSTGWSGAEGGSPLVLESRSKQFLLDLIRNNPPAEKFAAFRAGFNNRRFSIADQGQIAEAALEQSLNYFPSLFEENAALSELRYAAALALTKLKWTSGSAQAIRHFYRVRADFQRGDAPRDRFLEAIACLGAMGTSDAALVLGLQLGLLNAQAERTGSYQEDIILAMVQALGAIGDKSAFSQLLYISNLSYPEHIQAAAEEALSRLRW